MKPFASDYWSTCLLHRIWKVSSNHLIYSSKGNKSLTLESYICHWIYIQIFIHSSNTRLCILKIILKLMVSTLDFKSWVVFTCIILYSICIKSNVGIDSDWIIEVFKKFFKNLHKVFWTNTKNCKVNGATIIEVNRRITSNSKLIILWKKIWKCKRTNIVD